MLQRAEHGATDASGRFLSAAALIYLVVLGCSTVPFLYSFALPAGSMSVHSAQFMPVARGEADALPPDSRFRSPVSLPDDWRRSGHGAVEAWYRAEFELAASVEELWAIVIPTVRMNAAVYLNGSLLGDGGRFEDPVARHLRRPLIFSIPNGLLVAGANVLHLRVKASPDRHGFLSALHLGPEPALRAAWQRHHLFRVTSVQIITLAILLMSLIIGALALVRPQEPEYAWFSAGTFIWALHSLHYFVVRIPVSDRVWDWLVFTTLGAFAVVGGVLYVHRFLRLHRPALERRVIGAAVALALLLAVLPQQSFYAVSYRLWHPLCQAVGLYGVVIMLRSAGQGRRLDLHIIAASGIVLAGYALHDLFVVFGWADWEDGYYIQYSMPFVIALFSIVLMQRFVRSLEAAELSNRELEQRVAAKGLELESQYRRAQALENERVLAAERERIMRDMHDGIGGQLVSALALIERGNATVTQVERGLRAALADLRIMIDSLDAAGEDIPAMLGMFRSRVEPSLLASGIALRWDVRQVEALADFGSRKALHVLRIMQEAITNVLKHSAATEVRVSACDVDLAGSSRLVIEVADNGKGLGGGGGGGRGIDNMRRRAALVNADLKLDSGAAGTSVRLSIRR